MRVRGAVFLLPAVWALTVGWPCAAPARPAHSTVVRRAYVRRGVVHAIYADGRDVRLLQGTSQTVRSGHGLGPDVATDDRTVGWVRVGHDADCLVLYSAGRVRHVVRGARPRIRAWFFFGADAGNIPMAAISTSDKTGSPVYEAFEIDSGERVLVERHPARTRFKTLEQWFQGVGD